MKFFNLNTGKMHDTHDLVPETAKYAALQQWVPYGPRVHFINYPGIADPNPTLVADYIAAQRRSHAPRIEAVLTIIPE